MSKPEKLGADLSNADIAKMFIADDDLAAFTESQLDIIGDNIRHTMNNCICVSKEGEPYYESDLSFIVKEWI